jgi:hypothetical protein
MSRGTILIVEDEAIVAADLARKLEQLGYRIAGPVARGEDALDLARRNRPDLVLMDIRLAGALDGIAAADTVRRELNLPVVFLTALSGNTTLERAKLAEPFGYLVKPFEEHALRTTVEMAIYKHQADEKLRASEERLQRLNAELEQRVADRTAALQATVRSLEELLSTIAHDLRAPNRAMQGFATVLLEDYSGRLDGTGRSHLRRIADAALRNDRLICELLEYGRLAQVELPGEVIESGAVLREVLAVLEEQIRDTDAVVRFDTEWPQVTGNRRALEQVLTNLIANALTFRSPGRRLELSLTGARDGQVARLTIRDNGIGIGAEDLERIFAPFPRLDTSAHYPGIGMGLAIVRKAVERMHGRVWAVSEPGRGSEFVVELPAAPAGIAGVKGAV